LNTEVFLKVVIIIYLFIYLGGWGGTKSIISAAIYWLIVPALE
jgi:hypothetical protein